MYDRVLVATDGSDDANVAVEHAVELARGHDADLHALYVIETRTAYDNAIVDPETVRKNLREDGEAALEALAERAGEADLTAVTEILEGVPHEEIAAYAKREAIDVVVVGARGKSAFKTVLLGSTAERLLESAGVPVVVVGGDSS